MSRIILVHGASHGAWCWERVVPDLEALGHDVRAIDLPGLGDDPTAAEDVGAEDWGNCVAAAARDGAGKALIVGHSMGGVAIAQGAELAAEHVLGLVFLSAILIGDGESIVTACQDLLAHVREVHTRHPGDADGAMIELLYAGSPHDLVAAALNRLRPQPEAIFTAPMRLTAERFGKLPRSYIECRDDGVLLLEMQRRMHRTLTCDPVITMEGDHSPFLGQPGLLASHIDAIARRFAA